MNAFAIEAWARRVVERVIAKQQKEDDLVELKRRWPDDHRDAARRIAGSANAARGDPVMWLIGVDEKSGVEGAEDTEPASWWDRVRSNFDAMPPSVQIRTVSFEGTKSVVALVFETDGAPFVVKTGATGQVSHEVPYRDMTGIRTARRADLFRILHPAAKLPEIQLMGASIHVTTRTRSGPSGLIQTADVTLQIYVVPSSSARLVMPFHECGIQVFSSGEEVTKADHLQCNTSTEDEPAITVSRHQVIFQQPAMIVLFAVGPTATTPSTLPLGEEMRVRATFGFVGAQRVLGVEQTLENTSRGWWKWSKDREKPSSFRNSRPM